MTREELRIISAFLDSGNIEALREYINSLKLAQFSTLRQTWFEHYLSESPIATKTILYDDSKENQIICSNGISLYYINANYVTLLSPTLVKNTFCQRVTLEEIEKFKRRTEQLITQLIPAEWFSQEGVVTKVENESLLEGIFHIFKTSELNHIDWILGHSQYKIDKQNAILCAESEVGRAYVLGYRNNHQ